MVWVCILGYLSDYRAAQLLRLSQTGQEKNCILNCAFHPKFWTHDDHIFNRRSPVVYAVWKLRGHAGEMHDQWSIGKYSRNKTKNASRRNRKGFFIVVVFQMLLRCVTWRVVAGVTGGTDPLL